ncbi:MAG TPA: zf-HC2 domain-containing protein, partial [Spirochaetota bacterium]|nr:zf-HC2 domain-containing protein [Spirochaetota bacterium]
MKCRDARELINSYIDNGLDPEKDKFLMEHVKKCSRCSEELRFLIVYRKTVKKIKPVKAPAGFMSELNKRIELEQNSLFRNYFNKTLDAWHHFTFPVEAVGVIAVALLIFFLYTP